MLLYGLSSLVHTNLRLDLLCVNYVVLMTSYDLARATMRDNCEVLLRKNYIGLDGGYVGAPLSPPRHWWAVRRAGPALLVSWAAVVVIAC